MSIYNTYREKSQALRLSCGRRHMSSGKYCMSRMRFSSQSSFSIYLNTEECQCFPLDIYYGSYEAPSHAHTVTSGHQWLSNWNRYLRRLTCIDPLHMQGLIKRPLFCSSSGPDKQIRHCLVCSLSSDSLGCWGVSVMCNESGKKVVVLKKKYPISAARQKINRLLGPLNLWPSHSFFGRTHTITIPYLLAKQPVHSTYS